QTAFACVCNVVNLASIASDTFETRVANNGGSSVWCAVKVCEADHNGLTTYTEGNKYCTCLNIGVQCVEDISMNECKIVQKGKIFQNDGKTMCLCLSNKRQCTSFSSETSFYKCVAYHINGPFFAEDGKSRYCGNDVSSVSE
ncbi:hypothetical protein BB559_005935, partial [Furculomyces boomerangus]